MSKHVTIVLSQDVPHLGAKGDVRTVSFGYAKNALLPKGLAVLATPGALEQAKRDMALRDRARAQGEHERSHLRQFLTSTTLSIRAKANEKGSLFGGISSETLADALRAQGVHGIERGMIVIPEKIESVGDTSFIVTLGGEQIKIPLHIEAES